MRLDEALDDLDRIRARLDGAETYRGYRSATVAASAGLAVTAALVQGATLDDPLGRLDHYLLLWIGVAAMCVLLTGLEMWARLRREPSPRARRLTRVAVEQFSPALAGGALVTCAIVRAAPEDAWMLPGLWSVLFGLGVAASARLLPAATVWVAVYYLIAGAVCLVAGGPPRALAPWTMVVTFGVGQTLAAVVLYFGLERRHER